MPVPEVLFRRRRWPGVAGGLALLVVAGAIGVAVATGGSDGGDVALDLTRPSPTFSPSSPPEILPSFQPPIFPPSPAPSATGQPAGAPPPPRASRRPVAAPSPTPFAYPPPGISLQVTARRAGGTRVQITIRVRDTDGTFNGGRIDFGDGTNEIFNQAVARCASPTPGPYRAEPSDSRLDLVHRYPRGGSYNVVVRVRTDRLCQRTPVEQASKTIRVTVPDAPPPASASPAPSPTASASPAPAPRPPG